MNPNDQEVARRTSAALAAIKRSADEGGGGDFGPTLFASHHLAELDAAYWEKHAGTSRPSTRQILDLLVLRSHWGDDDDDDDDDEGDGGIDTFDFTLPGDVTDYVISVRFDESGQVEAISMES